jgi:hypothetical protein
MPVSCKIQLIPIKATRVKVVFAKMTQAKAGKLARFARPVAKVKRAPPRAEKPILKLWGRQMTRTRVDVKITMLKKTCQDIISAVFGCRVGHFELIREKTRAIATNTKITLASYYR